MRDFLYGSRRWWTRTESNPRPGMFLERLFRAYSIPLTVTLLDSGKQDDSTLKEVSNWGIRKSLT